MDNYDLFIPNLEKLGFVNTINMSDLEEIHDMYTLPFKSFVIDFHP